MCLVSLTFLFLILQSNTSCYSKCCRQACKGGCPPPCTTTDPACVLHKAASCGYTWFFANIFEGLTLETDLGVAEHLKVLVSFCKVCQGWYFVLVKVIRATAVMTSMFWFPIDTASLLCIHFQRFCMQIYHKKGQQPLVSLS